MKILTKLLNSFSIIFSVFAASTVFVSLAIGFSYFGYVFGFNEGAVQTQQQIQEILVSNNLLTSSFEEASKTKEPEVITKTVYITPRPYSAPTWSGPELWEEVNKRRLELGVNEMGNVSELCTIASIRLNELLELGKLDGHEGFSNMPERREDLLWIFEKYNISEFLVSGASTPKGAVSLWENTLGHKKLLTGGEYVWGCIYAQAGFGVAITAF